MLNLTPDELLTTTRSVRKRLDFSRPVEPELIRECLQIAVQAPTGGNRQHWHFVVVTDSQQRQALGDIYRKGWDTYRQQQTAAAAASTSNRLTPEMMATLGKVLDSANYLAEHMHEAPVMVIPCGYGRVEGLPSSAQAGYWGSIFPATWSFMLAARARGLGTCWTSVHLHYEKEAAEVLGIPYDRITQGALIPVAHTIGENFKPAPRIPLDDIVHWDRW